jgi:hypothetical protein
MSSAAEETTTTTPTTDMSSPVTTPNKQPSNRNRSAKKNTPTSKPAAPPAALTDVEIKPPIPSPEKSGEKKKNGKKSPGNKPKKDQKKEAAAAAADATKGGSNEAVQRSISAAVETDAGAKVRDVGENVGNDVSQLKKQLFDLMKSMDESNGNTALLDECLDKIVALNEVDNVLNGKSAKQPPNPRSWAARRYQGRSNKGKQSLDEGHALSLAVHLRNPKFIQTLSKYGAKDAFTRCAGI